MRHKERDEVVDPMERDRLRSEQHAARVETKRQKAFEKAERKAARRRRRRQARENARAWCERKIDHMTPPGFEWMPIVNWAVAGIAFCTVISIFRFLGRYGKARRSLKWVTVTTGRSEGYMEHYYGVPLGESPWFLWTGEVKEMWTTVMEYITAIEEGEIMSSFSWVMNGVMTPFAYLMTIILLLTIFHYLYYYHGSKSIYLMKRLPKRSELHRRSLMLPLTLVAACVVIVLLLTVVYYGWYFLWVPDRCIMPGQLSNFLREGIFTMWRGGGS